MAILTRKKYLENCSFVITNTEKTKEVYKKWVTYFKLPHYKFEEHFENKYSCCNGGTNNLDERKFVGDSFYTVWQLEGIDEALVRKPQPKELTVAQIIEELGYEVKIVK